jgi:hypothetical protein
LIIIYKKPLTASARQFLVTPMVKIISNTENKIKTSSLPTGHFIFEIPKH